MPLGGLCWDFFSGFFLFFFFFKGGSVGKSFIGNAFWGSNISCSLACLTELDNVWAPLQVERMLQFVFGINQLSFPTPFYSICASVSVFMALSTISYSINSPTNSASSLFVLSYFCLVGPFYYMYLYQSLPQP